MTARVDWDSLPGDTPILNITGKGLCPDLVAKLANRTPATPPPQGPATVPGVPPIPSQPGWSVDALLRESCIQDYHRRVQEVMTNRGVSYHEAHALVQRENPGLMPQIQRYSKAATHAERLANRAGAAHGAARGDIAGREAVNAYREAVEALCNRGVNYSEAHRQVQAARPELLEAMSACGGRDRRGPARG